MGWNMFWKKITLAVLLGGIASSCFTVTNREWVPVDLPFIKNDQNECYFIDEFMPMPDAMTTGRTDGLNLRYYSYKLARYKKWDNSPIILAFYSRDGYCWSLFEEYYVVAPGL
jgi:hypothetical protein